VYPGAESRRHAILRSDAVCPLPERSGRDPGERITSPGPERPAGRQSRSPVRAAGDPGWLSFFPGKPGFLRGGADQRKKRTGLEDSWQRKRNRKKGIEERGAEEILSVRRSRHRVSGCWSFWVPPGRGLLVYTQQTAKKELRRSRRWRDCGRWIRSSSTTWTQRGHGTEAGPSSWRSNADPRGSPSWTR
jgi:hypothetical protein